MILVFAGLLVLQGLALAIHSALLLAGVEAGRRRGRRARRGGLVSALGESLDLAMFLGLCGLILIGFPVAFTLAGTALIFAGLG